MFSLKTLVFVCAAFCVGAAMANSGSLVGGPKELTGDELKEAEETLNISLTKLATGDGPSYKVGKVISASRQVVSGSLYKYLVELVGDDNSSKKCNVKIWSQPWLENGIEVTIECEGEDTVVKKHSA